MGTDWEVGRTRACLACGSYQEFWGFPGGAVVENLPANAGDTGSSPGLEDPTCRGAARPVSHNY